VIADWESFFVAQTGAFAALAGLVFVALSINLKEILEGQGLPGRAAEAIALMVVPVFTGLAALVPHQSLRALGIEYLVIGGLAAALFIGILRGAAADERTRPVRERVALPLAILAVIPTLVAAVLLISGNITGLDWLAAGTLICLFVAILDAWVLLVEILR
jgi:modulator of FtsH protease